MPTPTFAQLTAAQQTVLCHLAEGLHIFKGRYSGSIAKLRKAGLIAANLGLRDGRFYPPVWHCSLTDLGRNVLFPADTATISHKDPA
jgi:hypothetical protein